MGPAAFALGHAGLKQMVDVLLAEHVSSDGAVLVSAQVEGWKSAT